MSNHAGASVKARVLSLPMISSTHRLVSAENSKVGPDSKEESRNIASPGIEDDLFSRAQVHLGLFPNAHGQVRG